MKLVTGGLCLLVAALSFFAPLPPQLSVLLPTVKADICSSLPVKIYDSGTWEWWINDPTVCSLYLSHQSAVDSFRPYPDLVMNWLKTNLGGDSLAPSKNIMNIISPGGGYTTNGVIGIGVDAFYSLKYGYVGGYAYIFIAHEMANAYVGVTVSGGWPMDWWADDRSPFPLVTAVEITEALNWRDSRAVGAAHYAAYSGDSQVRMFKSFYDTYGTKLFYQSFNDMRADKVNWYNIAPTPSKLLTNYVAAYLMLGAGTNLTSSMLNVVPGFDDTQAFAIMRARTNLQSLGQGTPLWAHYLDGDYAPAFVGHLISGQTADAASDVVYDSYNATGTNFNSYGISQEADCFMNGGRAFTLVQVEFELNKIGLPHGRMYAVLYAASGRPGAGAIPTGNPLAQSLPLSATVVPGAGQGYVADVTFNFAVPYYTLAAKTGYCISFQFTGADSSDWFEIRGSGATPLLGNLAELPANSTFGYTTAILNFNYPSHDNSEEANCFTSSLTFKMTKATFTLNKQGSPTGSAFAVLYAASGTPGSGAVPSGVASATSNALDVSRVIGVARVNFTFASPYTISSGTNYCISFRYTGGDASNWLSVLAGNAPPFFGNLAELGIVSGTWATKDVYNIYVTFPGSPEINYPWAPNNKYNAFVQLIGPAQ